MLYVVWFVSSTALFMTPQQITSFLEDYPNALARANELDAQVNGDASRISADYASIVALSIRQALGAMEITVSKNSDGSWNTGDVLVFMKGAFLFGLGRESGWRLICILWTEISSSTVRGCHSISGLTKTFWSHTYPWGFQSVNTVDNIYAAWPAFLYLDPTIGKYLLMPLLEYQGSYLSMIPPILPRNWFVYQPLGNTPILLVLTISVSIWHLWDRFLIVTLLCELGKSKPLIVYDI